MYQPTSYPDPSSLQKWQAKKNGLRLGITSRFNQDHKQYNEQNLTPRRSQSPMKWNSETPIPLPSSESYGVKLSSSKSSIVPGSTSYDIPITDSLYLNVKNKPSGLNYVQPKDEVDYLTRLMVNGLDNCDDPHIIGMCYKCGTKISGEVNGCIAMGQVYHVTCFNCCKCDKSLRGNPFYVLNGQHYCKADYYNTLEKCAECYQPITDKIINAEGKTYHAHCFNCVNCRCNLDGISFALNDAKEIHCVSCYHEKYAPRCCKCSYPIAPTRNENETVCVVALNRKFHVNCYKCDDCFKPLSQGNQLEGCFPHSGFVLCETCYYHRIDSKVDIRSVLQ